MKCANLGNIRDDLTGSVPRACAQVMETATSSARCRARRALVSGLWSLESMPRACAPAARLELSTTESGICEFPFA